MSVRNSEVEMNGWTTFDVPNQFDDLQRQLATGSYYVQNLLDVPEINTRLQSEAKLLSRRSAKTNFSFVFRRVANSRTTRTSRALSLLLQHRHVNSRSLDLFSSERFFSLLQPFRQSGDQRPGAGGGSFAST